MLRRFQLCPLFFAWFLATGSQWDIVQTFGWARMIVDFSETMTLQEAVGRTFSPGNECEVCRAVRTAKNDENNPSPGSGKSPEKIKLVYQPALRIVFCRPPLPSWPLSAQETCSTGRPAPPVPPPRSLA